MLSPEDNLRLNVMLANKPLAIRINESSMTLYALLPDGKEATVRLHASVKDEAYLKVVRELLEEHAMSGSGYPLSLKRWSRMGQTQHENLAPLLLLGEEEAVIAVVHAPNLTPEIAENAWWAMPESTNARELLRHPKIVTSSLAPVLAAHLEEYLAFETEALYMAESVCLMLQEGLLTPEQQAKLWRKAQHKNAYLLGFLWAGEHIELGMPARDDLPQLEIALKDLGDNPLAKLLLRLSSSRGQNFIALALKVLKKPNNQEIVNQYLDILAANFSPCRAEGFAAGEIDSLVAEAQACVAQMQGNEALLQALPNAQAQLAAMSILARLDYAVVRPIFSRSTAIGSLMRKKIKPVTDVIAEQLTILQQSIRDD